MLPLRSLYYSSFFPILFFLVTLSPTLMSSNFFILFPAANLLFPLNPSLSVMLSFFPKQTAVSVFFLSASACLCFVLLKHWMWTSDTVISSDHYKRACSVFLALAIYHTLSLDCLIHSVKKFPSSHASPSSLSVSLRLQSGHSSVHIWWVLSTQIKHRSLWLSLEGLLLVLCSYLCAILFL